jgi:hypothetical protein
MRFAIGCALLAAVSCTPALRVRLAPPAELRCGDGRPVKLLIGEMCPAGICGWSCEPDRWR